MLKAYLCSRLDTAQESDDDEEVNVYTAHLLHSLVDGSFYNENAEVLADHRLSAHGLFAGFGGHQGRYRKHKTPRQSYLEQAQQY